MKDIKRLRSLSASLVLASAMLLAQPVLAQNSKEVVAKLGSIELTTADVKRLIDSQPPEVRLRLLADAQLLDRLVRTEVFRRALAVEARRKGFDKKPEVAVSMRRAADQALVSRYVTDLSRPPADYPNDKQVLEAYKANRDALTVPAQYHIAQVFVSSPPNADQKTAAAAEKKINDIARLAQRNVKFETLAQRSSDHKPSAEKGGDLGWVVLDQMVPEIRDVVTGLKKGGVSKPVRTDAGWHIVKLLDQKPASVRPFPEVKDELARLLRVRKAQENERKYLDELVARTPLGVNEIALNKLLVTDEEKKP